jgi:hypothetical protein
MANYGSSISFASLAGAIPKSNFQLTPQLAENLRAIFNPSDVLKEKQNALISAISQFQTEELYGDVAKRASEDIDQYRRRAQEMLQTNKGMNRLRFTDAQQVELQSMRTRLNQDINYATGLLKDYDKSVAKAAQYFSYGMLDEDAFRQVGTIHDTWKKEISEGKGLSYMTDPTAIMAKNMTGKPLKEMAINKVYPVLLKGQDPYESFDVIGRQESFRRNFPENSSDYKTLYKPQDGMSYDEVVDWYVKGAEAQFYQKTHRERYQSPTTVPYKIDFIKTSGGKYFANLGAVSAPYRTKVEDVPVSGHVVGIEYNPDTKEKTMIFDYQTEEDDPNLYGRKRPVKKRAIIPYDNAIEENIDRGLASLDFSAIPDYGKPGGTTYYRVKLNDGSYGWATRKQLLQKKDWTPAKIDKLEKKVM